MRPADADGCATQTWALLHADAEPVLQLIQSGQAPLLEGLIPEPAEYLTGDCAVPAEVLPGTVYCSCLVFIIHCYLLFAAFPAAQ
jgi:hypothetical protein